MRSRKNEPLFIMCHGKPTLKVAHEYGWLPGARYTNLRDIRGFNKIGLIDIDWTNYSFEHHLEAVKIARPHLTVARDIVDISTIKEVIWQARELNRWAKKVVVVPKDPRFTQRLLLKLPSEFLLGYSVPTKYAGTTLPPHFFGDRPVHLLGGRPDVQYRLSKVLNVYSLDGNRVTLDATFGEYFAKTQFRKHPTGGYYDCIRASLQSIETIWREGLSMEGEISVRQATRREVNSIKKLADSHKMEIGFLIRPAVETSIKSGCLYVARSSGRLLGFVRFHHRLDLVTKIYEICVDPTFRRSKVGWHLLNAVKECSRQSGQQAIVLKCPVDLPANGFYEDCGFADMGAESGKKRKLRVWQYEL